MSYVLIKIIFSSIPKSTMAHDFGNLLLDDQLKDLSDVELLVGPSEVPMLAHKVK